MAWDDVKPGGGGGEFLKIEDGKTVRLRILSDEPHSFSSYYNEKAKRSITVPDDWDGGEKRKQHAFLVATMVVDAKGAVQMGEVKIWTVSNTVAGELKNIYENYDGTLTSVDIKVSRAGTGKTTRWGIVPVPTKFKDEWLEGIELPDLATHEAFQPADEDSIAKVQSGEDPAAEFDGEALESKTEDAEAVTEEEPVEAVEEEAPRPVPKQQPVKAAVPTKPAGDQRTQLIRSIMSKFATMPKYKDPKVRLQLFKKVSKKQTMGDMAVPELQKLAALVK